MMINKRNQPKPKGWFESFIDDTTFIEKIAYIIWCGLPYGLFIMLDFIPNILTRLLSVLLIFTILSLLIYGFAVFMSSDERNWNR